MPLDVTLVAQAGLPPEAMHPLGGLCWIFGGLVGFAWLAYGLFWVVMLVDCLRREPDRQFWFWLLIVVPFPGAIVYAVVRYAPERNVRAPSWLRRLMKGRELQRLEVAAEQIGNAHQFLQWGDALRDLGDWKQAGSAYARALERDRNSLPALWGSALVAEQQKRPADVKEFTARILAIDPQYKFGDVSLAHARALLDLHDDAAARSQLETHLRRWRHPESLYLMATCCQRDGDLEAARGYLKSLLQDIAASPPKIARKFGRWKSRGKQLLRQLG